MVRTPVACLSGVLTFNAASAGTRNTLIKSLCEISPIFGRLDRFITKLFDVLFKMGKEVHFGEVEMKGVLDKPLRWSFGTSCRGFRQVFFDYVRVSISFL